MGEMLRHGIDTTLDWWLVRTPAEAAALMLLINIATTIAALVIGYGLTRAFAGRRVTPPPEPLDRLEILLAVSCILLNSVVTFIGWWLWQAGYITVRRDTDLAAWADTALLVLVIDLAMYGLHRSAHHLWLYSWLHQQHHRYHNPRPIDLFVLNPLETLGFGALWLLVLLVYPASFIGITLYMGLNLAWGIIGHLGVEPVSEEWLRRVPALRWLGSSTFHADHHQDGAVNFGFYTTLWDRLFGTYSAKAIPDGNRRTR